MAATGGSAKSFDVIVLGLGGMGSAAAAHLARRGARVLGIEQHALAHDRGASHGESRLIRKAYFESPRYVPLLHRAYELWDELHALTSGAGEAPLLHRTGLVMCAEPRGGAGGSSDGPFARARAVARQAGIAVEELGAAEAMARWSALRLPEGFSCLYEPGAGYLEVERCVRAHCALAERHGATLRFDERVRSWSADAHGVEVVTALGTYRAGALVIAAGPWSAPVLAELALPLRVHRVVQLWFPASAAMAERRDGDDGGGGGDGGGMPCYAFDAGGRFLYGFPVGAPPLGRHGAKICEHAPGQLIDASRLHEPDAVDRALHPEDFAAVAAAISAYLPEVTPRPSHHKTCLYTMTPDEDFLVDRHPHHERVCFAAGFSGHGFKFSSVIGEILADLSLTGRTTQAAEFLQLARLARLA